MLAPFTVQAFVLSDFIDLDALNKASKSEVTNKVNLKVGTGSSTAKSGDIIEGQSKIEVDIKSKINGQEIEPIDIDVEKQGDIEVKVNQEVEADAKQAKTKQEIEINGEKETKDSSHKLGQATSTSYAVKTENSANNNQPSRIVRRFSNWWSILLENLRFTIANIFKIF